MTDITFKDSVKQRIVDFLHRLDADKVDHALQCFTRALAAIYRMNSSAVVAYYDDETTFRMFKTPNEAFDAFKEYQLENAPCVLLTVQSVRTD